MKDLRQVVLKAEKRVVTKVVWKAALKEGVMVAKRGVVSVVSMAEKRVDEMVVMKDALKVAL